MKVGVIIGRFQVPVLSRGHWELIKIAATRFDKFAILLGVSPTDEREGRHPLSWKQRADVLLGNIALTPKFAGVFPLFDNFSDQIWSAQLDLFCSSMWPDDEVILCAGTQLDSFWWHYTGKRQLLALAGERRFLGQTGTELRQAIKSSSDPSFLSGQCYALSKQYPRTFPTVDIGVLGESPARDPLVLMIQRADTGEWCLPGGFVDPTDSSLESAARRELHEEVGNNLDVGGEMVYVRSFKIHDWRYRDSRDGIMTALFKCHRAFGAPAKTAEVVDFDWFDKTRALGKVSRIHKPLVEALFK